jgi:geranyl-CoA carboxylase alpha subunit
MLEGPKSMNTFSSVLVANRGEIAVRVIRGAKALGYRTIAVYSEADADAPHVRIADDAILIGAAPVAESYLSIKKILEAAKKSSAEAIHPGYGFLSENADFARECKRAGLIFIGPDPESIDLMGNKAAAKRFMLAANVPCVPGYEGEDQSDEAFISASNKIGFPIMVKAAAGGGGRGMRIVETPEKLKAALSGARTEALNGFGSDELILEKAIMRPRHVEFQVFADRHKNVIHLGERDCSVQRRHQKVIEEAPCPVMTQELRDAMGKAAIDAARAINYVGAGTVEFLLDEEQSFYFLEMNTRLQVEHPVTELVTGIDLVALQLKVAQNLPLGISQNQVDIKGHAIEVRLYAEDPAKKFLPKTGHITLWQEATGPGVRTDSGVHTDLTIGPHYDPMLAKVIAYGENREVARRLLIKALKDTLLFGVTNNRSFLIDALQHETFVSGMATTAFIGDSFTKASLAPTALTSLESAFASVLHFYLDQQRALGKSIDVNPELLNWSSTGELSSRYQYQNSGNSLNVLVTTRRKNQYRVHVEESALEGELFDVELLQVSGTSAQLQSNGHRQKIHFHEVCRGEIHISLNGQNIELLNQLAFPPTAAVQVGDGQVTSPMHGAVLEVLVLKGDKVIKGQILLIVEAMKMQHEVIAQVSGTIRSINTQVGTQVPADSLLMEIEEGS